MTAGSWLTTFGEPIDDSAFRHAAARAVAAFMRRYGASIGCFVEARRRDEQELLVLDLLTGAPQRGFLGGRSPAGHLGCRATSCGEWP